MKTTTTNTKVRRASPELNMTDPGLAFPKGPTRLQETVADRSEKTVDERAFKKTVHDRDGFVCRCCRCKVIACLARVPERREIHHIHGRIGVLRVEARCALVVCCECHEKLTGKVNEKLIILATKTFKLDGRRVTDARAPVVFKRVA